MSRKLVTQYMIGAAMLCDSHKQKPCGCQHTVQGKPVWSSEKAFSSNTLSDRLFGSPCLLSDSSLPELLQKVGGSNGDTADMRTIIMAIGHFLNTFPLPFWLYDLPGLDM